MDISNRGLAEEGRLRMEWAAQSMPVLRSIGDRFGEEQPLAGTRVSACLHVTTETGMLMRALKAGGAEIRLCASNPLSTQDDVAAALTVHDGIDVFAIRGEDRDTYYQHIRAALDQGPQITMDDGADLVSLLHSQRRDLLSDVRGGTEETTTGVIRLKSMAGRGVLQYPMIAVNDADTKHLFDNRYGTGQSAMDGIVRATNRLLAGSCFVVSGYGWCGRGLALRASGMGARVVVTEVDPVRALEAVMDGYQVLPMEEASGVGDFYCTVTGDINVITREHFESMKDGAIVANAGHFNVEIDLDTLADMAESTRRIRDGVEEFRLRDGRRINVLTEGRLINLSAGEGHPSSVMDMSFANQALCVEYILKRVDSLEPAVHGVPREIDRMVARLKLDALGISIDSLTEQQDQYLHGWETGT